MLSARQELAQKQNLHLSLKLWLPILQAGGDELERTIEQVCLENPYLEMSMSKQLSTSLGSLDKKPKLTSMRTKNRLESDSFLQDKEDSFYAFVLKQIDDSGIFPTKSSKNIALEILENISEEGYFDGSIDEIASRLGEAASRVESVRQRFRLLEPAGVGAKDFQEGYLFQLGNAEVEEELYGLTKEMVEQFDSLEKFVQRDGYKDALKLIKSMNNPPAIEFFEDSMTVVPDITIEWSGEQLGVKVNNFFGFDLAIVDAPKEGEFSREKQKEAREVSGLLNLRKTTMYNIAMIIANKQFKFFCGGAMTPLKMQEVADLLGFNQSTVSRAVANKYIACDRGVFAMKEFFTSSLGDEVAPFEIKEFVKKCVECEDKSLPASDDEILVMVQKRFAVDIVRRTITKYRDELGLGSSKERKKFYRLCA
jgi:RNA polymerase sigma-54 factor